LTSNRFVSAKYARSVSDQTANIHSFNKEVPESNPKQRRDADGPGDGGLGSLARASGMLSAGAAPFTQNCLVAFLERPPKQFRISVFVLTTCVDRYRRYARPLQAHKWPSGSLKPIFADLSILLSIEFARNVWLLCTLTFHYCYPSRVLGGAAGGGSMLTDNRTSWPSMRTGRRGGALTAQLNVTKAYMADARR
jgi:hypothetical protein